MAVEMLVDTEVVVYVETSVAVEVVPVKIVENSVLVDRADERLVRTVVPVAVYVEVTVLCLSLSRLRLCLVPAKRPMKTELKSRNMRHATSSKIVRGVSGSRSESLRR